MSNEKKRKKSSRKYVTLLEREFPFQTTEAFKSLRANLIFSLSTRPNKVLAVTSAMQHEGKSNVAANLAITFAQMDAKVLIIDADLRKPVQHKMFKQKNKAGLSTLLAGMTAFKDVVCENVIPGLDVLVSGPIPPNPSEMLASDNMKQLIKELADYYDYIIIDTPPVNIVSDTISLLDSIAGVVLAAMSGVTTYESYQLALDAINFAHGSVLGSVITCCPVSTGKSGKGRYSYKYGYKYGYGYSYGYEYSSSAKE